MHIHLPHANAGVCLLDGDEGEPCSDRDDTRNQYYYYDADEGECKFMRAHECGGNGNRFQSELECLRTCDPSSKQRGGRDIGSNENVCLFVVLLL